MLATETRVQVSILGYLFSDLKEVVGGRQDSGVSPDEKIFTTRDENILIDELALFQLLFSSHFWRSFCSALTSVGEHDIIEEHFFFWRKKHKCC